MQIVGVALMVVGLIAYTVLWFISHGQTSGSFTVVGEQLIALAAVLVLGTAATLVVHELVHGVAMLPFGAKPRFGAGMMAKVMPYFYCTAPGHRFTRRQFVIVALAPLVVMSAALAALVVWAPMGGAWAVVGAVHLGGCVGDLFMVRRAMQEPRGTLVEDQKDGMAFFSEHASHGAPANLA